MTIWIDAQLTPAIATWIREEFQVDAVAIRELGLRDATDLEIFIAAGKESVTVMTKDADFLQIFGNKRPTTQNNLDHMREYFECPSENDLKESPSRGNKIFGFRRESC